MGVCAYDGTSYVGWQTQPTGRGVQDVLETRLSQLFGGRVYVAGSGRTDQGVHARGQVFHFEPPAEIADGARVAPHIAKALAGSDEELAEVIARTLGSLSSGLPTDVQVRSIEPAPAGFHAREDCSGKRYVYAVHEGVGDPTTARYRWTLGAKQRLDVPRMAEAAARLVGTHDFSTIGVRSPTDPRPPVKQMRRLEVRRHVCADPVSAAVADARRLARPGSGEGAFQEEEEGVESVVTICAECDRYLYNMMRLIAGTLVQVGLGRMTADDVSALLAAKGRKAIHHERGLYVCKAPAHGLTLHCCFYGVPDGLWMGEDAAAGEAAHASADTARATADASAGVAGNSPKPDDGACPAHRPGDMPRDTFVPSAALQTAPCTATVDVE